MSRTTESPSLSHPLALRKSSISNWVWVMVASLIMFLMSYSPGLHAGNPYHVFHYPMVTISVAILFFISGKGRLVRQFNIGVLPTLCGWLFLCVVVLSAIIGNEGYFSAFHITVWHLAVMLFWFLHHKRVVSHFFDGIILSWLSVIVLSMIAIVIGLYMQYIGPITLGGLAFSQPPWHRYVYPKLISWFASPNRTGPFFMYGLMGCIFCLPLVRNVRIKRILVVSSICLGIGVLLAASRSAIVSSVIFLSVANFPWLKRVLSRPRPILVGFVIILGLIAGLAATNIGQNVLSMARLDQAFLHFDDDEIQVDNRSYVWELAISEFRASSPVQKLFGIGPGALISQTAFSSHSGWLSVMIEEGFVGLLLLLTLISSLLMHSLRRYLDLRHSQELRLFFLNQTAFWLAFAVLNVPTAIFTIPRLDSFVMVMVLTQFGIVNTTICNKNVK